MLAATGRVRLRLTSIAPWQFDPRLLELLVHPRVCRHVHLSLQSGSSATLERMRRPDRPERFAALVAQLRQAVPGIAVTSDVIVGFPGETEQEWRQSLELVEALELARLHVFRYSERPDTLGAELPDAVPMEVRKARVRRLREVAASSQQAFVASRLGAVEPVLWERRRKGRWLGTSDNYLKVSVAIGESPEEGPAPIRGSVSAVRLTELLGAGEAGGVLVPAATRQ
jgi:threonylcarbamoyladenosine tRNA methylthiotransferase MtaB